MDKFKIKKSKVKNIFASGLRSQTSDFILKALTCSLWLVAICGILFLLVVSIPSFAQEKIVTIVNSDIITQKDLNDFINFMRMQLSMEYTGEQLDTKIQSIKLDLLDRLIEDRLILQEANKNNVKIDDNMVKAKIDEIKKHYASDREFQDALTQQGLVQADIELKIREQLLMHNIIEAKVRSKIIVNPVEVTDFYKENIKEFKIPEQREFESITADDENIADDIYNNLKNGEDFSEVAKKYSLVANRFSAAEGGELKEDIEKVIFKLNLGEVSGPVKIQGSFYIFKLANIIPLRAQGLSEVQDRIYEFLFNRKMQEGLTKWLDDLKKQSYIKIMQE